MCGRYQRRSDKQRIAEAFYLGNVDGLPLDFPPDYNAANTSDDSGPFGRGPPAMTDCALHFETQDNKN